MIKNRKVKLTVYEERSVACMKGVIINPLFEGNNKSTDMGKALVLGQ